MIKDAIGDAVQYGVKSKKRLERVTEQALRPEVRKSIDFAIHHLELAGQYMASAFDAFVEFEKSLTDES